MAKASYLGLITCPICGNENATVHKQETGTKKGRLYYRCYETINGSAMRCGTIQCIGPTGQTFINSNLRPIAQPSPAPKKPVDEIVPEPIGQPEPPAPVPGNPEPGPIGQPEPEIEPIGQGGAGDEPKPIDNNLPEPIADPVPEKRGLWRYLTQG